MLSREESVRGQKQSPGALPLTMRALEPLLQLAKNGKSQPKVKAFAVGSSANKFCCYERHI